MRTGPNEEGRLLVAIVTGAGGGIGSSVVDRLLGYPGWGVIGVDQQFEVPPPDIADRYVQVLGDVRDNETVSRAIEAAQSLGCLTALANVAGVRHYEPFLSVSPALLMEHLETNCAAPLLWMQGVAGSVIARQGMGSIVNVTSVMAERAVPHNAAYSASKGALAALSRAAALDLAPARITVNCVAPGPTDTAMLAPLDDGQVASVVKRIPVGRLGAPQDIADAVAYLLAAEGFVTGVSLPVDGGYLIA